MYDTMYFPIQTTLYEAGKDALEREFRNLLTRHTKPVPAVVILDVLADDELETSEPQTLEQLSGISFDSLCGTMAYEIYGELIGTVP